jgi:CheY-like chemotaxis protein
MNVVLVEDSMLIAAQILDRLAMRPSLRVVGHAVSEEDAVTLILDRQPDAVLLDLSLRPGSGLNVIRRIRERGSRAQILVLTNFTHPELRNACLKAGVSPTNVLTSSCSLGLPGLPRALTSPGKTPHFSPVRGCRLRRPGPGLRFVFSGPWHWALCFGGLASLGLAWLVEGCGA